MDNERYEAEHFEERKKLVQAKLGHQKFAANFNYRLIQDFEVPEWIQQSAKEQPVETLDEYGLGKRKRADVTYKEQLSENQWLKIIEAGGDPQQEIEKRRKTGVGIGEDQVNEEEENRSDRIVSEDDDDEEMSNDEFIVGGKSTRRRK